MERFAPSVEAAAYFVVAESLRRAGEGDVAVSARREDGRSDRASSDAAGELSRLDHRS